MVHPAPPRLSRIVPWAFTFPFACAAFCTRRSLLRSWASGRTPWQAASHWSSVRKRGSMTAKAASCSIHKPVSTMARAGSCSRTLRYRMSPWCPRSNCRRSNKRTQAAVSLRSSSRPISSCLAQMALRPLPGPDVGLVMGAGGKPLIAVCLSGRCASSDARLQLELRRLVLPQCLDEVRQGLLQRGSEGVGRVENEHTAAVQSEAILRRPAYR